MYGFFIKRGTKLLYFSLSSTCFCVLKSGSKSEHNKKIESQKWKGKCDTNKKGEKKKEKIGDFNIFAGKHWKYIYFSLLKIKPFELIFKTKTKQTVYTQYEITSCCFLGKVFQQVKNIW